MNAKEQPIGIFDSGVGGLTVFNELKKALPNESFVYLGDTARVPYGTKSKDTVIKYALENSLFLMNHAVKLIVVACNTASAMALDFLQQRLKTPVIGVIEPGAQTALNATTNKHIGVIGTEGTIKSNVYEKALKDLDSNITCFSQSTGLLVPIIEEGVFKKTILNPVFHHYLDFFQDKNVDTLILGCTHYPILKTQLSEYLGTEIKLVDSAEATAKEAALFLKNNDLLNDQNKIENQIFFSDTSIRVKKIAQSILQDETTPILKQ